MTKRAHESRPGIEPGQILPLSEFVYRARISRTVWQSLRTASEASGLSLALRFGAKSFIDTTVFIEFLRSTSGKKTTQKAGVDHE
jgi:hypothetical protein